MKAQSFSISEAEEMIRGLSAALNLNLLLEARHKLDEYFDPATTKYELEKTHDAETGSDGLILEVYTDLDCESAFEILDRFKGEWWVYHMPVGGVAITICPKDVIAGE